MLRNPFRPDPKKQAERIENKIAKAKEKGNLRKVKRLQRRAKRKDIELNSQGPQRATIKGRGADGQVVVSEVDLDSPVIQMLLNRQSTLEDAQEDFEDEMLERFDILEAEVQILREDLEQTQIKADGMFSRLSSWVTTGSAAIRAGIQAINLNDKVQNRLGLVLADGFAAMKESADRDGAVDASQGWGTASIMAKAWAYYDSEKGPVSVITADPVEDAEEVPNTASNTDVLDGDALAEAIVAALTQVGFTADANDPPNAATGGASGGA